MSGGSYNYLCHQFDAESLMEHKRDLESMAERLAGLGYAKDAALETQSLLLDIRAAEVRIEAAATRLREVWHAVEWWDSGDSGEDQVKDAPKKYRGEP